MTEDKKYVVGQQVSGDDYAQLPVESKAAFAGVGSGITKVGEHEWHDSHGCPLFDVTDYARTLTHLPEHAEPEDTDDAYVEPEPLKNGEWTQAWVRVVDASVIGGEVTICLPRTEDDHHYFGGMTRISEDALIRTDDAPPWLNEERPVTVTISGTRVFSEESGAPMIRLETGPGSYALIPVANISSITEGGAS